MPRYRLHLEWDDEYSSLDRAKEDLRDTWNEIEQMSSGALQVFDVQPLPKGEGIPRSRAALVEASREAFESVRRLDSEEAKYVIEHERDQGVSFTEDVMGVTPDVTHPWDQGARFFPEGHPLYDFETEAIKRDSQVERQIFERVAKELGPGE